MTSLQDAIANAGMPQPPANARLSNGVRRWGKNNCYWLIEKDDVAFFGDYSTGESHQWFADDGRELSPAELAKRKEKLAELRKAQQAEQARIYDGVAASAQQKWEALPETGESPYLQRKQVGAFGVRFGDGFIAVPLCDAGGKIWSLQYIFEGGEKRFSTGGRKRGCFHIIGDIRTAPAAYVAEGYATAASIYMATGKPAIIAFDAGNLEPVVEALKAKFPALEIIIAADNDAYGERNTGREKAEEAARKHGCKMVLPAFKDISGKPTDWNDLHCLEGLEAVKSQLLGGGEGKPEDAGFSETIKKLSALTALEYEQVREAEAKRLGVRVSALDEEIKASRKAKQPEAGAMFSTVEPWQQPVEAGELLNELVAVTKRFIVCEPETAIAVALWCAFTWVIDHVQVAPLAVITAPEKRCGKSQTLNLIGKLVKSPLVASNISPSAVFRVIEAYQPTLLIDEADTFFKDNEELRGVINSGHTRQSAYVIRNVGDNHEPKQFSTWGAKAISGIGGLSDTLMDRAIVLNLRRKLPHEKVERLRHVEKGLFEVLASKLARFALDAGEEIGMAKPELPEALNDRAQDNWEPLLAIADYAGRDWGKLAREVAIKLSAGEQDSLSLSAELLADIKEVFETKDIDRISSADLISALCKDEEKPWATYNRGKQISSRQLSRRLAEYHIQSKNIRIGFSISKGFELEQFADAFARYLHIFPADTPENSATPLQTAETLAFSVADKKVLPLHATISATKCSGVADCSGMENQSATLKAAENLDCSGVADNCHYVAGNIPANEVDYSSCKIGTISRPLAPHEQEVVL